MTGTQTRAQPARALTQAIVGVLLSVSAGLAQPAAPDTVVAVPYTPAEEEGYGEGDYILVTWDAVEGAAYFRLWREVRVTTGLDGDGNIVELETPEYVWIPWGLIDAPLGEPVVRVVVATLDGDLSTRWALTALHYAGGRQEGSVQIRGTHYLQSEPRNFHVQMEGIGTAVQARSWGDVKRLSGGVE